MRDRPGADAGGWLERTLDRVDPAWVGAFFLLLGIVVYVVCNPARQNIYNHFVWQADAFLQGRAAIDYPVSGGPHVNDYFQDVMPIADQAGRGLLPFPPLPGLVLVPFVAVFGLGTNAALVAAVLGGINVGLCWRMLSRVTERRAAAFLATVFFGFGTVAWYAAMLGSTWFLAHVVASTFLFLGITAALDADARAEVPSTQEPEPGSLGVAGGRQLVAGLLFGTAALARLTTIFGAPFFVFVGGGGGWIRRAVLAGLGALIPVLLLLAYNQATTGHPFSPAYEFIRQNETRPKPDFYHPTWATEDLRYIPQNAQILLLWPPLQPQSSEQCAGTDLPSGLDALIDRDCPILQPDPLGMSILLTSPAYLLAIPALLWSARRRVVAGAALATLAIALADLAHFSQGWVQFGYRFSNDFAPFAAILVALGIAELRRERLGRWLATGLVVVSVAVNAWGVYWGVVLGW